MLLATAGFLAAAGGCGKKGPPLAPLNLAPEAPQGLVGRRLGDTVYLQMRVPAKSASGTGPFSVDHLDVYAVTIAPGAVMPANRDLLKPEHVVGTIAVQPPLDPDAPEPETPDPRPRPGDMVTFTERLTAAQMTPETLTQPPAAKTPPPAPSTPSGQPAAPVPPSGPQVLTRLYVVQGVPRRGSAAARSPRVEIPLLRAPDPPTPGSSSWDESSIILTWTPPATNTDEASGVQYNVYAAPAAGSGAAAAPPGSPAAPAPLNPQPLSDTTFSHPGAEPGKEQCFVLRSVAMVGTAAIESAPSAPACVTPQDTFAPAPPAGLAAVGGAGVVNLIWDASPASDLAGYLVLRGPAGGDTLQPLTPQPIAETRFSDRTAAPGVRYAYAVVAIDKAGNRSAPSDKVEEAAR